MAQEKILNLETLQYYDEKLKAHIAEKDAAVLEEAKKYTDEAPFDPAGTAQTKVNELANGAVKANTEAIEKLNGDAETDGSVAKKIADALTPVDERLTQAVDEAKGAADAAQEAADAAQADVDALVVDDGENKGRIPVLEEKVQNLIDGTYDDTEVRGLIQQNADDIDALEGRAQELEDTVGVLVGTDTDKSVRTIANEELAKQLIAEGAKESLDTLTEIAAWIQSHPDDASAMSKAIDDLEALVGTLPEGITATTVVGYIQEVIAAEKARAEEAEGELDQRLKAVEDQVGVSVDGETVDERIAAAKQEAIETAASDATTKADKALTDAKAHTDAEVDKLEAVDTAYGERLDALEGKVGDGWTPITTADIDALFPAEENVA